MIWIQLQRKLGVCATSFSISSVEKCVLLIYISLCHALKSCDNFAAAKARGKGSDSGKNPA